MVSNMIIQALLDLYKSCTLCPRACRVDRTKGELGYCRLPADIVMDCALAHHGEEPPLSGTRGAGTIFLSSCNLGCIYCQNYQISHSAQGRHLTVLGTGQGHAGSSKKRLSQCRTGHADAAGASGDGGSLHGAHAGANGAVCLQLRRL